MRDTSYARLLCLVPPMSLKARLDACRRAYEANAASPVVVAMRRSVQALADTGLVRKAAKAGEAAPRFRLRRGCGGFIDLSRLLERGPVVLSFFWGDWCPFCVLESEALAAVHAEIERLGATLVALSPQDRPRRSSAGGDGGPPFLVVQDPGCEIAARYRIAFTVPKESRDAYLALGHPGATAKTTSKAWVLPIPATYVLDSTGLVVLCYLDPDHTTRLEPVEVIVALSHLRKASIPRRNDR